MSTPDEPLDLRPCVSVVIPAFNEETTLPHTLTSLANQDFPGRYEVIVVDNASTDRTAAVATDMGARVLYEPQRGVCWARQRGTAAAHGDIVISTDADTTHPEGWLSRIHDTFSRHPDASAVVGPCRFVDGPLWSAIYPRVLFGAVHGIYRLTRRTLYATATNIAFRRSAWTEYDTTLTQGGDELDQLRRLRRAGDVVFDRRNVVNTSARRLQRGLLYNVFVTLFFYYLLGYLVNRVAGREVLPTAPHVADTEPRRGQLRLVAVATVGLVLIVLAMRPGGGVMLHALNHRLRPWV